jgi:hypothetical protein
MLVTALWITLLVLAVLTDVVGRRRSTGVATLSQALNFVVRRVPGRVILVIVWIFIGFHLFSRYTIPPA